MKTDPSTHPPSRMDTLLSWDRLGFRLLFFGGLGMLWIAQGRLANQPFPKLILAELAGIMPWAFLASMVLALNRRFPVDRVGWIRFLLIHLAGMVVITLPYWCLNRLVQAVWLLAAAGWTPDVPALLHPKGLNLARVFGVVPFPYFITLLGAMAMDQARAREEARAQASRLTGQLAEARLSLLQRQLHPHFLFNALQAISTLLYRDPKVADGVLVKLSTLLRNLLDEAAGPTLTLGKELELTRKYLDIEQVRFGDRLQVVWNTQDAPMELPVPSLMILPLVENAIRHGLSTKVGQGSLTITAVVQESYLVVTVTDDGLGATPPLRLGVGLGNTRERVEALYGAAGRLDVETQINQGFEARIQIPLTGAKP